MTDDRVIVLGMCDPSGTEPLGIEGVSRGAAGHRLWRMSGMTVGEFLAAFDRQNLLPGTTWNAARARRHAAAFCRVHRGRVVVVLGRQVWAAFGLRRQVAPCHCLGNGDWPGNSFFFVPHPSGRNMWYNDRRHRRRVGELLRRLAECSGTRATSTGS